MGEVVTTYRIDLPYRTPPITSNSRLHWAEKARIVADIKHATCILTKAQKIPPCDHITFQLHYLPRTNRRREVMNLEPVHKPALDGVVTAGVVPDDNPRYVTEMIPVIHPADTKRGGQIWVEVTT